MSGAQSFHEAITSATLAFLVFTFGSLLFALQVASSQLTPRIIATTLLNDNAVRYTVGLFMFALMFALSAQNRLDKEINRKGRAATSWFSPTQPAKLVILDVICRWAATLYSFAVNKDRNAGQFSRRRREHRLHRYSCNGYDLCREDQRERSQTGIAHRSRCS